MSTIVEVDSIVKHYPEDSGKSVVHAVCGVSIAVEEATTLSLVGESGSGKSTILRMIAGLVSPTSGSVKYRGQDLSARSHNEARRSQDIQMVFQSPRDSLNPRLPVGTSIAEPLRIQGTYRARGGRRYVVSLLERVGLTEAHASRLPRELSGGQQQRVAIARAIAPEPSLILLDEAVSALDVSVQSQILDLLVEIQKSSRTTYVFVTHDLAVANQISDNVVVLHVGKIVESGSATPVISDPHHPYTRALISAVPVPDPVAAGRRQRIVLAGEIPSATNPPSGCRFRTRCWMAQDICAVEEPPAVVHDGHVAYCHFA